MSLRPRYSLLTLLILTALVAGGVKLWYGPHRVVERVNPMREDEYTYTHDWRGNRVHQGPFILRAFDGEGRYEHAVIYFKRDGKEVFYLTNPQMMMSYSVARVDFKLPANFYKKSIQENPLSDAEIRTLQQVIENEKSRLLESNPGCELREGYWPDFYPEKIRSD